MRSVERDQEFAELLSAVIERHAVASRLQRTATLAEEILAAAMRVGDGVRRALREGATERPSAQECDELADLAKRLEDATDALLAEPLAAELRRAIAHGDMIESARLALDLFAGLDRPATLPARLYAGVVARRRSRSGETLVHPAALAEQIAARNRDGIGPASGDDADEASLPEPIALAPSLAGCGSEIALVRESAELRDALVEDTASGDLLVFSRRVPGPFSVAVAIDPEDEWWVASTFRYADYREQLSAALSASGITVELVG
ncbi:hypothetical protein K2Z84_24225 [Candidatus Binatia bacterium]|jgi:hypothetical protein|nr:hypothetical protein [Candidatus Binatia bacterium]